MKNRHRVSQAVSKLICSRAAGRKILKRVRRIAPNIAMLGASKCRLGPSRGTARYPRSDNRAARSLVTSFRGHLRTLEIVGLGSEPALTYINGFSVFRSH
jgi:hypothetical protein